MTFSPILVAELIYSGPTIYFVGLANLKSPTGYCKNVGSVQEMDIWHILTGYSDKSVLNNLTNTGHRILCIFGSMRGGSIYLLYWICFLVRLSTGRCETSGGCVAYGVAPTTTPFKSIGASNCLGKSGQFNTNLSPFCVFMSAIKST